MEKDSKKERTKKASDKQYLTDKQKEIIITILVVSASVAIGIFVGKMLFELMYGSM